MPMETAAKVQGPGPTSYTAVSVPKVRRVVAGWEAGQVESARYQA